MDQAKREWIDWSDIEQLRKKHSDFEIVDFEELNVGDKFIYKFDYHPSYMIRIEPEKPFGPNARNLKTGGKHIIVRWMNSCIPVARLKPGQMEDDLNIML